MIFLLIGQRKGVSKILFLITDGNQNPKQSRDGKIKYDPVVASQPMIDRGKKNLNFLTQNRKKVFAYTYIDFVAKSLGFDSHTN